MSRGLFVLCSLLAGCNPPREVVRQDELRSLTAGATAIVVVYSRSGHTSRVARALAKAVGADYLRLTGSGREGDSFGSTPSSEAKVEIHPAEVDLRQYRWVFLGTPIWYWKPSALINTFIEANDLGGKQVVLFYTNQGGISSRAIEAWKQRVSRRGGVVREVIGIDRKRLQPGETEAEAAERLYRNRTLD